MMKVKNRRRQARIPWEGEVSFQRSVVQRGGRLKSIVGQGQLENLSGTGLCLTTDAPLSPKQFLQITIPVRSAEVSIPTLAFVQWSRPLRGQGRYAAGLSFLI